LWAGQSGLPPRPVLVRGRFFVVGTVNRTHTASSLTLTFGGGTGWPRPGVPSRCRRCLPGRRWSGPASGSRELRRVRCRPGCSSWAAAWPRVVHPAVVAHFGRADAVLESAPALDSRPLLPSNRSRAASTRAWMVPVLCEIRARVRPAGRRRSARSSKGPEIRQTGGRSGWRRLTMGMVQVHECTWSQLERPVCPDRSSCACIATPLAGH
jgi:hypothetical protein